VTLPAALSGLVEAWMTVPDAADALGVSVTDVRQLLRDGQLVAVREEPGAPLRIPAAFFVDGQVLKGLPGVVTLLRDARFDDAELVRWLFTADDSLPGTPVAALAENRGREVRRRAQAAA
jgi:excisionase family DNA binding protein